MKRYFTALILLVPVLVSMAAVPVAAQSDRIRIIEDAAAAEEIGEKADEQRQTGTGLHQRAGVPRLEQAVDPAEYVLGPYDILLLNIIGPEARAMQLVVLPEGYVFIPGIGGLRADGLTLENFREELSAVVDRYFKNVTMFCYLQQPRAFRVFVTGEVGSAGAVDVSAVERVSDAIDKAGSITSLGSNRKVLLERDGAVREVDILKFVLEGDFSSNPFLSNGDRIHVPVADMHVVVRGSVNRSSVYEALRGETVEDLISLAGGFRGEAHADTVLLSRVEADGSVATMAVPRDKYAVTELKDRDEINVMDGMTGSSRVYVFGAAVKTGHYFITEGEGLTELIARIGQFQPDVDFSAASIERISGEIIRLDLKDYIPPTQTKDMPLMDGDMLHIPAISRTVAVGGEVNVPGRFNYEGDWTVAQYVGLAGGPTENGSINRVVIYSPDGISRNGDGSTRPNRGDVIIVKRSKAKIMGSFFGSIVTTGMLVLSIIAVSR